MLSRRRLLRATGAAGLGGALVWGLTGDARNASDLTEIQYAVARTDPDGGPLRARTKTVPTEWYESLQVAFAVQRDLRDADLTPLVGSFAVPGSFDDPEASVSVDATDEGIEESLEDLSRGLGISLNVVDIPPNERDGPTVAESYQDPNLDRKRVPGGYTCVGSDLFGTLAPALYDERGSRRFATSNHVFGAEGAKRTEHAGKSLSLVRDDEVVDVGEVVRGYPLADVVEVVPVDGYWPVSAIARATPRAVVGQYTKLGLADLMARGEELRKIGAFSNRTSGVVKGIDGLTCYVGDVCKRGQLKWGTESTIVDGDSGSVNFHEDPEHPDEYVLVGGIDNARTWWPGMDFTWGTAAHHLRSEYGLHF